MVSRDVRKGTSLTQEPTTVASPGGQARGAAFLNPATSAETNKPSRSTPSTTANVDCPNQGTKTHQPASPADSDSLSPVRVKLISLVRVPPHQNAVVQVQAPIAKGTAILEPAQKTTNSLGVGESLIDFSKEGTTWLALTTPSHHTRVLRKGTTIGTVCGAEVVNVESLFNGEATHPPPLPELLRQLLPKSGQCQEPSLDGQQPTSDMEDRVTSRKDDLTLTQTQLTERLRQDGQSPCHTLTDSEPPLPMTDKSGPTLDEGCLQSSPTELVRRVVGDQP